MDGAIAVDGHITTFTVSQSPHNQFFLRKTFDQVVSQRSRRCFDVSSCTCGMYIDGGLLGRSQRDNKGRTLITSYWYASKITMKKGY